MSSSRASSSSCGSGASGERAPSRKAASAVSEASTAERWLSPSPLSFRSVTSRPLRSIMRSRRAAYPASSDFRHRFNGIEPQEPSDIKELPA